MRSTKPANLQEFTCYFTYLEAIASLHLQPFSPHHLDWQLCLLFNSLNW
ncbi:MAG: hypothetical protein KME17_26835 [Cyanosarcina radialis HA8281-LM2]|nr:hypothetical protein [Cyanosarcina radialis HA8281-LM2]